MNGSSTARAAAATEQMTICHLASNYVAAPLR